MLSYVWLFATPWTVACQAPLSTEFFKKEYWSGLPTSFSMGFCYPRDRTHISTAPTLQLDSLSTEPLVKPKITSIQYSKPENLHSWYYTTILPWGHSHFINCLSNNVFSSVPRSSPEILGCLVVMFRYFSLHPFLSLPVLDTFKEYRFLILYLHSLVMLFLMTRLRSFFLARK